MAGVLGSLYPRWPAAAAATQIDTATTKASTNPMVASTSFSCYV